MMPVGVSPLEQDGPPLPLGHAALLTLAIGAMAYVFGGPYVGIAVAALSFLALAVRWGLGVVRVVCVGLFGAAVTFILAKQARNDYQTDFRWVERFELTHAWAVGATMLLTVEVIVDSLRARRRPAENQTVESVD